MKLSERITRYVVSSPLIDAGTVNDLLGYISNVEALESQIEAMKWISVKDRLPVKRERVLIEKDGHIGHARRYSETEFSIVASNNIISIQDIAYWMPLPEPPKESEE